MGIFFLFFLKKLEEDFKREELERIQQVHGNNVHSLQHLSAQHSYPFRSLSPNYATNTTTSMSFYSSINTSISSDKNGLNTSNGATNASAGGGIASGAVSPSSSSSSGGSHNQYTNNTADINDVKTSFSSMKINRRDD